MADSLTSFGGIIFGPNSQTTLLAFINASAAGSYGTVTEPSANPQKFPDPQNHFYQARGSSLAKCYYQSLYAPYEGLIVGEPLAAPFAQAASGGWIGVATNAVLSGTAQLGLAFSALDGNHPLQQIDLFVDGQYFQTLTNCAPSPGNLLTVALNGCPLTYTVPTNANLSDLQPRNHLYVTAGASQLALTFPLDTTKLADGFHDLAAMGYEGSDVRTQTRIILPIQIQNSPLSASLTLLDLPATAPVQETYHIQAAANTNSASAVSLFSNGGLLSTLANQSTATFTVNGSTLGVGLLPFYAQVQTTDGGQYKTQVQWVRLINPQ
jgi:hypothetical protein